MSVTSLPEPSPFLVVFGRDNAGKPHASWFDQASSELATKAAGLMNMSAVPVETDELRELVSSLPRGRVFSSGRAFTPFVNGKLYNRLVELTRDLLGVSQSAAANENDAGAENPVRDKFVGNEGDLTAEPTATSDAKPGEQAKPAPGGAKPSPVKPSTRATQIEDVGLGSIVLATTGPTEGWFEAEVIGMNGSMLTLKWCDYNEPTVIRRPSDLSFLPAIKA